LDRQAEILQIVTPRSTKLSSTVFAFFSVFFTFSLAASALLLSFSTFSSAALGD
jgi:hypothetical protein